jgi:hypothetical protein
LNDKVNVELNLVNATPGICHSFAIHDPEEKANIATQLQHATPGDVITLRQPPLSVNIKTGASGQHKRLFDGGQRAFLKLKSIVNQCHGGTGPQVTHQV